MGQKVEIDLITEDSPNEEYVLYLVEDGPWPTKELDWKPTLKSIQDQSIHRCGKYCH
jgi:hypothetical protein